jgi:hypothetical protein
MFRHSMESLARIYYFCLLEGLAHKPQNLLELQLMTGRKVVMTRKHTNICALLGSIPYLELQNNLSGKGLEFDR